MLVSAVHADDDAEESALRAMMFEQTIFGDPLDDGLDLTILAPNPAQDRDFPILSESVLYDISQGRVSLALQGPVSCFDLREDWRNLSEVTLRAVDVNYNPVIDVGLTADLNYLINEGVVALNAGNDAACFYGSDEDLYLFGNAGLTPASGLEVRFEPIDPANPQAQFPIYVRVGDPVSYRIIVENTGSTTLNRVGVQELYRRALAANAPAGLDHVGYDCVEFDGAECADAEPETVVIDTEFGPITFEVPFIRGEQMILPPGASIEFAVTRTVELAGGASLADAFGSLIDLQAVVVNRDDMNMHAAASATMQVVGDGQLSAEVTGDDPAVVTEQGVPSTTVAVQLLDDSGTDLQEAGVEVFASIDSACDGVVDFPASSMTDGNGMAYFEVQSELVGTCTLEFEVPVLRDSGSSATTSVGLTFVHDAADHFVITPDMPEVMVQEQFLPDFDVQAYDQFGNPVTDYSGTVTVFLLPMGEFVGSLSMSGGFVSSEGAGLALPEGVTGTDLELQVIRTTDFVQGRSTTFDVISPPQGTVSVFADSTPLQSETLDQGQSAELKIEVESVDVASGYELAVLVDGSGPGVGPAGEDVCAALLVGTSCQAVLDAVGFDNRFDSDTVLFDAPVTVRADAPAGSWTLNFYLVLIEGQDGAGNDQFSVVSQTSATFTIAADATAGTGELSVTRFGQEISPANGNNVFRQGGTVVFGLEAFDASAGDDVELAVLFDGQAPPDSGITSNAGEVICAELLTTASCQTLSDAIGYDNTFASDTVLIDDELIEVLENAPLGNWTLNFYLVTVDDPTSQTYADVVSVRTVEIEVTEDTVAGTLIITGDGSNLNGQSYFLDDIFDLVISVNDLDAGDYDGLAVLLSATLPDESPRGTASEVCDDLLNGTECPSFQSALDLNNLLTNSGLVYDASVRIADNAPLGLWQLHFKLVAVEGGEEVETIAQQTVELNIRADRIFRDVFNGDED